MISGNLISFTFFFKLVIKERKGGWGVENQKEGRGWMGEIENVGDWLGGGGRRNESREKKRDLEILLFIRHEPEAIWYRMDRKRRDTSQ